MQSGVRPGRTAGGVGGQFSCGRYDAVAPTRQRCRRTSACPTLDVNVGVPMLELVVKAHVVHPLEYLVLGSVHEDRTMAPLAFESHNGSMPSALGTSIQFPSSSAGSR